MSIPTYEGLLASTRFFADRALQDYTFGDHHSVLVDAGTFVEHLSKALLIKENPSYLVELKPNGFDHLLHLTGRGDRASLTGPVRTVGAREALTRVRRLVDITDHKEVEKVLEVRNDTVHAGLLKATRTRQLLTVALRYCDEVYNALGVTMDDRWGNHGALVVSLVEQASSDIEHEVNRKVTAARARFTTLMAAILESAQAAVAAALQSALAHSRHKVLAQTPWDEEDPGDVYVGEFLECPVCKHPDALVSGPLRADHELVTSDRYDEPHDLEISALWIEPERLRCAVCGIYLRYADEVRLAGVPARVEITENIQRLTLLWSGEEIPADLFA